jgi:PQQ system protein
MISPPELVPGEMPVEAERDVSRSHDRMLAEYGGDSPPAVDPAQADARSQYSLGSGPPGRQRARRLIRLALGDEVHCQRHRQCSFVWRRCAGMPVRGLVLAALSLLVLSACGYVKLLRPSVLRQLNPRVVTLANELPELDRANEAIVGQIYAKGGAAHAQPGDDGIMRMRVRVPNLQYLWEPAVIIMPRGGTLEIEFENLDQNQHIALMPNNGGRKVLHMYAGERGRMRIELDEPGMYWFGCPVENHVTRGMLGFILVKGDVPSGAKLDRPSQPRPRPSDS